MPPQLLNYSNCTVLFYLWLSLTCTLVQTRTDDPGVTSGQHKTREASYTDCGSTLKNPRGVISTPDFPKAYPLPIRCRWIIEAPADKVVALYFTQYFMREGVSVTEYAFFSDTMYLGKKEFGTISSDRDPTYLVSNKPVLVINFEIREAGNVHLRVREHLLDVYGFNITYEMIGRNESFKKDSCLHSHCSFTGSCLVSASYKKYNCRCFDGFFGSDCQYSAGCGPSDDNGFCSSGGTCRYYIGSTVKSCECPPNFEGTHCEKKKDSRLPVQCSSLGCSQTCFLTGKGDYKCSCMNGFHLDIDEKTCVEKGKIRYLVSLKVYDQNVDLAHLDATRYNVLKAGIESTLVQLFQPRLHKAENLKVLAFKSAAVVQFHFFGESEDIHRAKALLEENLKRGRFGRYAVDKTYMEFHWEPALSIKGLESSEKMPLAEGNELTLACIVQGSSDMKVQWLKDGFPIDGETSYRTLRINVTPKNSKDQYTALIGFEKTHILDSGEFTCQVSDWGTVHNKSIRVTIVRVPAPTVIPLAATVLHGSPFVITCIVENDWYGTYGYNWLKNDRILNPSLEPEVVEDLFPGGSRLLVDKAVDSAKYACLATSKAGSSKTQSIITVLSNGDGTPLCPEENNVETKWRPTAANSRALELCPEGYKGVVERHCVLRKHNTPIWNPPNYSKCYSKNLLQLKEKFQKLKLGYQVTSVESLLADVRACLKVMDSYLGLGEPLVDILEGIREHMRIHEMQTTDELQNITQIFMDIASLLVESPIWIQKQSYVIKLHQQILEYGLTYGTSVTGGTFHLLKRPSLVLEVGRVRNDVAQALRFPNGNYVSENIPDWLTDSVELEIDSWFLNKVITRQNDSLSIAVVFYRNLTAFLPERFVAKPSLTSYEVMNEPDLEYQLHSRLVAVAMQPSLHRSPASVSKRSLDSKLKVKARLAHLHHAVNRRIVWNISCGMADFSEGIVQFSMEGCTPVQTGLFSLCQCDRVGTYVVLLTTYAPTEDFRVPESVDMNACIGCAVCSFFACLTFFILLLLWRKIKGAVAALKIQFCVAIIAAYVGILKSLQNPNDKDLYYYSVFYVQFFLLAAFSIQLCVALTVYFDFVGFKTMHHKKLKFAILAWAVPLIVVGASMVAQVADGFEFTSWWLKFHTKTFYAFSVSAVVLIVLQIMLIGAVRSEMKYYCTPSQAKIYAKVTNRWSLVSRSMTITLFLTATSISSIFYVNFEENYLKHSFGIFSSLLGFVIFLCYTACSENVHLLCLSKNSIEEDSDYGLKEELALNPQKSPFESFLKPEVVSGNFIGGKVASSLEMDENLRQLQKLSGHLTKRDEQDWKNIEQLLLQKKEPTCVVRDFTVHHPSTTSHPKDVAPPIDNSTENRRLTDTDDLNSAVFELQQLEGSPKSSHLQLQEDESTYELNHHGSAPDILETTSHQSTIERRRNDSSALGPDHQKLVCSTFRHPDGGQTPPISSLDVLSNKGDAYQKQESDSDDQKPGLHSTPPCPPIQSMIGDDKLMQADSSSADNESLEDGNVTLKRRFVKKGPYAGLNVPIPKVPEKVKLNSENDPNAQQTMKGWNMTSV